MAVETIQRCDLCHVNVLDVLHEPGISHSGYGYIEAKRYRWRFGPWPRFWHRDDLGFEIVCDQCIDDIREARGLHRISTPRRTVLAS
jgi:hypothetical protein